MSNSLLLTTLRVLGDLHDYRLVRSLFCDESAAITFDCISEDEHRRATVRFSGVRDFELVDHSFGTIIDGLKEIGLDGLDRYQCFVVGYRESIRDTISRLSDTEKTVFHLWVLGSSYGLQAAILAESLEITALKEIGGQWTLETIS